LNESGYDIFVISNQAGVGKGLYSREALDEITKRMLKEVEAAGAKIRSVIYCTHNTDDGCDCRKPKPGMIKQAAEGLDIDFRKTYFIGDSWRDIEAGKAMDCRTILLITGKEDPLKVKTWKAQPDLIKKDLKEAVEWVLKEEQG